MGLQNLARDLCVEACGGGVGVGVGGGGYGEMDIMRETHFKAPVSSMFLATFHS